MVKNNRQLRLADGAVVKQTGPRRWEVKLPSGEVVLGSSPHEVIEKYKKVVYPDRGADYDL